ncbi:hypothetical protein R1flu_009650 [Riccia fluitans]|uniref:Uncharacterized protein n=1 Tax=Riccia fluitans TaxID=41844 RepID=A0ABD1Z3I8_9MARC
MLNKETGNSFSTKGKPTKCSTLRANAKHYYRPKPPMVQPLAKCVSGGRDYSNWFLRGIPDGTSEWIPCQAFSRCSGYVADPKRSHVRPFPNPKAINATRSVGKFKGDGVTKPDHQLKNFEAVM